MLKEVAEDRRGRREKGREVYEKRGERKRGEILKERRIKETKLDRNK
jgi:hypothetical protein